MKYSARTFRTIILFIIFVMVVLACASCSPQARLSRLVKRHPELIKTDTVWGKVKVEIPPIDIDTTIKIDKDFSGVDSIFEKYKNVIDSITRSKIKGEIKYYVTNKPFLPDTVLFEQDGVTVKLWEENGMLRHQIKKPKQEKEVDVPVVVNTVEVKERTSWQKIFDFVYNNIMASALLFLFLLYLWRNKKK